MVQKQIVTTVIQLASKRREANSILSDKYYPNGVSLTDFSKYQKTPEGQEYQKCEKALDDYLASLSYADIKDLQTIMYLGRGDAENFDSMRKYLDTHGWKEDKWIECNQMSEKIVLDKYLQKGLELLGA
jgi:hypothetical protein